MEIFLNLLDHLLNKLTEKLSILTDHQGASHLESLFAVVITIVFSCAAKSTLKKSVDHVADKVSLL